MKKNEQHDQKQGWADKRLADALDNGTLSLVCLLIFIALMFLCAGIDNLAN